MARVKNDLSLPETDSLASDTLARVRKNLGSDFVVLGSYLDLGDGSDIRVDLRLQDAKTGQIVSTVTRRGSEAHLDDLITQAGSELREQAGSWAERRPPRKWRSGPNCLPTWRRRASTPKVCRSCATSSRWPRAICWKKRWLLTRAMPCPMPTWQQHGSRWAMTKKQSRRHRKRSNLSGGLRQEEQLRVAGPILRSLPSMGQSDRNLPFAVSGVPGQSGLRVESGQCADFGEQGRGRCSPPWRR